MTMMYGIDNQKTNENIFNIIKKRNVSAAELARMLNISYQAVNKWKKNNNTPSIDNLINISKIFNVSMDDLIIYQEYDY